MIIHELTLAFGVGADDDDELTFKTFLVHNTPPFVRVLNRGTRYVDYLKECRNQMRNRIRFRSWRTASDQLE